jgi:hypothetical protein
VFCAIALAHLLFIIDHYLKKEKLSVHHIHDITKEQAVEQLSTQLKHSHMHQQLTLPSAIKEQIKEAVDKLGGRAIDLETLLSRIQGGMEIPGMLHAASSYY